MVAPPPAPRARAPSPDSDINPVEKRTINGKVYQFPADKPLYSAHGKWAWASGHDILSGDSGTPLGYGLEGHVKLKAGLINETQVVYISKMTSVWDSFRMFFASLYLNASSKYLRPLQGDCVPWIIGVNHCLGGRVGVAQDLPHPTGWREADMFLKESQKEAIIAAYQKLHDRGILHGDAEYRHMLIGDDGKVTIIDFGLSSVLDPDEWARKAGLDSCSRLSLRTEMRKVKFLLDWKGSRETEFRLAKLRSAREERDRAAADAMLKSKTDPFERVKVPNEPMSEEEKEDPDGGLRLCDLNLWSYGDTWVAYHYEVERRAYRAVLKKTEVPRPPIPAQTTTESTNTVASVVPAAAEPVPILAQSPLTSTVSAGATDSPHPIVSSLGKRPFEDEPGQPEQKNVNAEHTKPVPLRYDKAGESDRPVKKCLLEDEPEQKQRQQKNVTAEHMKIMPLRLGKASGNGGPPTKRPLEGDPEKEAEQKQQKVNAEPTVPVPLKHGKGGEIEVPARKRPFEDEPEMELEGQKNDSVNLTKSVPLRHGNAEDSSEPARECSLEEGAKEPEEQKKADMDHTKAAPLRHGKSNHSEPARKRQKTTEASVHPTLNPISAITSMKQPLVTEVSLDDSMSSSTTSDVTDTMQISLLDDDTADPTPYELDPYEWEFLRGEAVRGLARFTTAKMRVRPLETQLDQENHNLEKRRSELLRIILMLPREDRTTLWTNMGQPDVQSLLGLLPETPGPSKSTRDLIRIQTELARREAASQGDSSNGSSVLSRESDAGFLVVQNPQAETSVKQKLHERLEIERKMDSLAMPPPPLPVAPLQRNVSGEAVTHKTSFSTESNSFPMVHSQRSSSESLGVITSESSRSTLSEPTSSRSTGTAQPATAPRMHPYYERLKKALDDARKANLNGTFSVSIPKEVLAWESKSTRKYTIPEGSSKPQPGRALARTPAWCNVEPIENTTLAAVEVGALKSETKRKREVTDSEDSKMMPVADEEPPDSKKRKTKYCDLI